MSTIESLEKKRKMTPREEVEAEIRIEMCWLRRAFEEISEGKLTWELKKYLSLAMAPWKNSGVRMNMPEFRKAIQLRKVLFGKRQKKGLPSWIFEFSDAKIEVIDRRIAERLRADLEKKLEIFFERKAEKKVSLS